MLWIISLNCWNVFHQLHGHNTLDRKVHNSVLTFEYSVVCTCTLYIKLFKYFKIIFSWIDSSRLSLQGFTDPTITRREVPTVLWTGTLYCTAFHYLYINWAYCTTVQRENFKAQKFREWAIFPFSRIKISRLAGKDPLA